MSDGVHVFKVDFDLEVRAGREDDVRRRCVGLAGLAPKFFLRDDFVCSENGHLLAVDRFDRERIEP